MLRVGFMQTGSEFSFLKTLKSELPWDPAIPLSGIYPKELKAGRQTDVRSPTQQWSLFTTAKMWKESRFPQWMNG